jgi:hypothetical protein
MAWLGQGGLMRTIDHPWCRGRLAVAAILIAASLGRICPGQTWRDSRVAGPFVCWADFSLAEMEGLFDQLAQLQEDLVRSLGIRPAERSIELCLFRDQWSYRRFLRHYFPDVPFRRALYIQRGGHATVLAYRSRQLPVDLRHECTHALLHAALPMVPLWLDEGLAEYFEVAAADRAFACPHLSNVRWAARLGMVSRLVKLENKSVLGEMGGSEYRNAWAWTHFMLHGPPEAHEELVGFLADIEARTPPGLLSDRLRHRLPDLERRFARHFRNWKP